MPPRISIVLPTYNQAHFLASALDSILTQTFRDFELIVVNDGSTDDTAQLLAQYSQDYPMRVVSQENQGLPRALNTGFAQASGEFWTWTSSDNILLPTTLTTLVQALDSNPEAGVVYADWHFIDEWGEILGTFQTLDYDRDLLLRFNFVHCCFLFRRICFEQVGGYNPHFVYSEDWEFWIRVSRRFQMMRVPQALYLYRIHRQSMTSELLEGRARRNISYAQFAAYLRRTYPLSWYVGKIKWKARALLHRDNLLHRWREMISRYELHGEGVASQDRGPND